MNIIKGFQGILPEEVEQRRFCEERIRKVFESWGYQEIDTPTLEYFDSLVPGIGPELKSQVFKLLNSEGEIMVLRPDMTTPIARLTATRLASSGESIYKFYYLNNVFRRVSNQTEDQQEFHQAGIELIGLNNRLADAEVIAVAIQALQHAGLENFYLDIGSASFFNSVLEQLPLLPEQKRTLRATIMNKDFVQLERLLFHYDLAKREQEVILRLPHWRGDESIIQEVKKIFGQSNSSVNQALEEIKEVYDYLKIFGLSEFILVDLGIIRNFDYYSGIVFEGYTQYSGSAICGGGRYDFLCRKFGRDLPSTGVAIDLEKLLPILAFKQKTEQKALVSNRYFIRYREDLLALAYRLAQKLRNENKQVEIELSKERSPEVIKRYLKSKKIRYLIDVQSEDLAQVIQYDLETEKEEQVAYE
ncbi:MAG: ATP phosphoribosyltransferase regulatory subunit [Candidatus Atribacteria bacterium]|nr:ATP phosphoribosyltransferase regulatory subunit [Candidatus Atribacteria bacterium]